MPQGKRPTKRQATPRQSTGVPQMKRTIVRGTGAAPKGRSVVGASVKAGGRRSAKAARPKWVEKVPTFGRKIKDREATPGPERKADHQQLFSRAAKVGVIAIVVASIALVAFVVLSFSPVFTVTDIETQGSERVSAESISKLAQIPPGTTLLNLDQKAIEANIKKNPWVESINIERRFPNTLMISVNERKIGAIVLMNSGSVAWYLGTDQCWIEPVTLDRSNGQTSDAAALALASSKGCILIKNVPATVQPVAGALATDDVIDAVYDYENGFSQQLRSQIVSFSANSVESLSCLLSNGVDVQLGAATNIAAKESAILAILNEHEGKITHINVRVASNPSYRSVDSSQAGQGTGVAPEAEESGKDGKASDDSAKDGKPKDGQASDAGTQKDADAGTDKPTSEAN